MNIERLTTPWWTLRVALGAATLARLTEAGIGETAQVSAPANAVGSRRTITA